MNKIAIIITLFILGCTFRVTDSVIKKVNADINDENPNQIINVTVFSIKSNKSLRSSVDAFFSRYNNQYKDPIIEKGIKNFHNIGKKILEKYFHKKLSVQIKSDNKSGDLRFKTIPIKPKSKYIYYENLPDTIKRILLTNKHYFKYQIDANSIIECRSENELIIVLIIKVEVYGKEVAHPNFKLDEFKKICVSISQEIQKEYLSYFEKKYKLEVNINKRN